MVADPNADRQEDRRKLFIAKETAMARVWERQTDWGTGRMDDCENTKTGSEERQKTMNLCL